MESVGADVKERSMTHRSDLACANIWAQVWFVGCLSDFSRSKHSSVEAEFQVRLVSPQEQNGLGGYVKSRI